MLVVDEELKTVVWMNPSCYQFEEPHDDLDDEQQD